MSENIKNPLAVKALEVAGQWQKEIEKTISDFEKKRQTKFSALVKDDNAKKIMIHLLDQSFRTEINRKIIAQSKYIFKRYGIPSFFSGIERILVKLMMLFGGIFPFITAHFLREKIFHESDGVVLPGEKSRLDEHITMRRKQNIRLNLNLLGELVLGESEAAARFDEYINALKNPNIDYISVKISGIYSRLIPTGHDQSKQILIQRLSKMYRCAMEHPHSINGQQTNKFINLDMEEYKDLELTIEVFTETLSLPEFKHLYAGIVIQAYLQDSVIYLKRLTEWAKSRVSSGGSPIKIRLVKGANKQVETVESALHGWENPVFDSKVKSDANYKKILANAMRPENIKAVNMGIASHNVFDLAYAAVLAEHHDVKEHFIFEMLEGMAETTANVIRKNGFPVLMYAPASKKSGFLNAVSYLVRRLDENTEEDNFLRHSFGMTYGSKEWNFLKEQFVSAHEISTHLPELPTRRQNREIHDYGQEPVAINKFRNEPETDFHLPQNLKWVKQIKKDWQFNADHTPIEFPAYVGAKQIQTGNLKLYYDPNTTQKVPTFKVQLAGRDEIRQILHIADKDPVRWRKMTNETRLGLMASVANEFRKGRADMIGCMAALTGKTFMESDNEITEGIDFAAYYPYSVQKIINESRCKFEAKGTVLVISPWNFPMAIPAGGVLSALATANTVILKPAPEAFPIALQFAKHIWDAGIPHEAFQVACCEEGDDLDYLVSHPGIKHIIFTGGTETAGHIIKKRPDIPVSAETGGKNSIIVTSMADWDQAVKDTVLSAFSNSGQKCSCASLLILEEELFYSEKFRDKLLDCAQSFTAGSAWDLEQYMGPLVSPPQGKLKDAIEKPDAGEWLLKPESVDGNPYICSPGILWGVSENSFCYKTELFGPVLSVMKAENLPDALRLANNTYGLTAGIQSLDIREQEFWLNHIEAGNLYVNRGITGAIVQRQPFGGIKESAFGYGIKAGGPNYVIQLMNVIDEETESPQLNEHPISAASNPSVAVVNSLLNLTFENAPNPFEHLSPILHGYAETFEIYFGGKYDHSKLPGQHNYLKFLTGIPMKLFVDYDAEPEALLKILAVMTICKTDLSVYIDPQFQAIFDQSYPCTVENLFYRMNLQPKFQTAGNFMVDICDRTRIRILSNNNNTEDIRRRAAEFSATVIDHPFKGNMRTEAVYYMQEQAISINYHRYGNCNLTD